VRLKLNISRTNFRLKFVLFIKYVIISLVSEPQTFPLWFRRQIFPQKYISVCLCEPKAVCAGFNSSVGSHLGLKSWCVLVFYVPCCCCCCCDTDNPAFSVRLSKSASQSAKCREDRQTWYRWVADLLVDCLTSPTKVGKMFGEVFWFLKWQCCCSCREIQSASGEWLKDAYALGSCSAVDHLTTSDVLRKSIRRSWTISSKYSGFYFHYMAKRLWLSICMFERILQGLFNYVSTFFKQTANSKSHAFKISFKCLIVFPRFF